MKITKITKSELEDLVTHWAKFASCYFWSPPGSVSGRRSEEQRQYKFKGFYVDNDYVCVEIKITCSCRNYYANRDLYINDCRKAQGLRYMNKLLKDGEFV